VAPSVAPRKRGTERGRVIRVADRVARHGAINGGQSVHRSVRSHTNRSLPLSNGLQR
jgi:hypothetical protein